MNRILYFNLELGKPFTVDMLLEAENNGERVILLGHIPPGEPDQIDFCSKQFYKIVNRFKDTIRAQFYGHTHWDHLRIFYEQGATNIAYVTPSVTTWVGMDPSFRVYEIDHWDNQDSTFTGKNRMFSKVKAYFST